MVFAAAWSEVREGRVMGNLDPPDSGYCHPFGRLRDGLTRGQTREALVAAARNIGGQNFARDVSVLRPIAGLAAHAAGEGDDRRFFVFFVMLFGTAALLALIACLNVAGLLLARGVARQRELAIRKALGANRGHIVRLLLVEGAVLVALGAAAGLALDAFLRQQLSYVRWPSAYNSKLRFVANPPMCPAPLLQTEIQMSGDIGNCSVGSVTARPRTAYQA
jgi:hypothetical protein